MRLNASWDTSGKLLLWIEGTNENAETESVLRELSVQYDLLDSSIVVASISVPANESLDPGSDQYPLTTVSKTVLECPPLDALLFLSTPFETQSASLTQDGSLLYWVECTKYLLELLTQGQYLPGIRKNSEGYESAWRLLSQRARFQVQFQTLAEGMPLAGAALERVLAHSPTEIIESFLSVCGEALIRLFLSSPQFEAVNIEATSLRFAPAFEWFNSLSKRDAGLKSASFEVFKLDQRLQNWMAPLLSSHVRIPLKLALVLKTPPSGESQFRLTLEIRHSESGKVLLTAQELAEGKISTALAKSYTRDELEEFFLRNLARACLIFAPLRATLQSFTPRDILLETNEAFSLLSEGAAAFEQESITLDLPDYWGSKKLTLRLGLSPSARSNAGQESQLGSKQLLAYSWKVALGDREITEEEFKQLVAATSPLVNIAGNWIEVDPATLKATAKFLEDESAKTGPLTLIEALRIGYGLEDLGQVLPVSGIDSSGWLSLLLERQNSLGKITQPSNFLGSLRPYQADGLAWLAFLDEADVGGCLADDMGLGKTIQFLALLLSERERMTEPPPPTLLVVPMSILGNWERECRNFAPSLRVMLHHGAQRLTGEAFLAMARSHDVVVTTYNLAYRDEALLAQVRWWRIALDEAQNIKNLTTKQTRSIRKLAFQQMQQEGGCRRLALTGTPLENHLDELWSIFDFLNPGYLSTLKDFRSRFALPIERYRDSEASRQLGQIIRPFVLRRLKSDPAVISDLPEKIEIEELVPLTEEQSALYQTVVDAMLPQVEGAAGMHRKGLVLATITKLKQICDHPSLFLKSDRASLHRSGKFIRLSEILTEALAEGDRILIFTQFAQMGDLLQKELSAKFQQEVLFLHGALNRQQREACLARFTAEDGPKIFVLSLKAGGLGLNLVQANHVIHYDQWWNPAVEEQATDRAYRIGQTRNVQVRRLITKGTLEEKIALLLAHKRDLADRIVGKTGNIFVELSQEELVKLLSLSRDSLASGAPQLVTTQELETWER